MARSKLRIDEIAPYPTVILFVSLDGIEKTHDRIRGVNGCFKEALKGIAAAKNKVSVTINTTIMSDNINEIEDIVKLAKDLGVRIVLSAAHEYHNIEGTVAKADEIRGIAKRLIELKRKGYPIMNSTSYFKVIAKEKNWKCKPWSVVNIGTDGQLVLPCYVHNQYETSESIFEKSIKETTSTFDWRITHNCMKCNLHCYVEPSLVCSWDLASWIIGLFQVKENKRFQCIDSIKYKKVITKRLFPGSQRQYICGG